MNAHLPHAPLAKNKRNQFFWLLFAVFLVVVPAAVFYATGYRISFTTTQPVTTVGGLFISADTDAVTIYVAGEAVERTRLFREAAYVSDLREGFYVVETRGQGVHTWAKRLPVYSRKVTEAQAFNLPVTPQLRYIPAYLSSRGTPVLSPVRTKARPFAIASTTNTFITQATTSLEATPNAEHAYVRALFAGSTSTAPARLPSMSASSFTFAPAPAWDYQRATTSRWREYRDMLLRLNANGALIARWQGEASTRPYYFCVPRMNRASTTAAYGAHVTAQLPDAAFPSATTTAPRGGRTCRSEIVVVKDAADIRWFDFLPGSMHHVVLQRADGVYVREIDDRATQNEQLLYPASTTVSVRTDDENIYIRDGALYFELQTQIAASP